VKRVVAASLVLLTGCVLGPHPRFAEHVADGTYCASRVALDLPTSRRDAEDASVRADNAIALGYSPRALEIARAIGALAQVERLAAAVAHQAPDAEVADLRGRVNDTISLATLDLASTMAHLSCEEGRAAQIAGNLRDAEQAQNRRLTAYSLVLSAVAAIAGGVLAVADKNPVPAASIGIAGGVAGGGFGFATLAVQRKTTFAHRRNILAEVWRDGEHPSFPSIIWAYLTRPEFSRTGDRTLRDYLVSSWKESGRLGDDPAHPSDALVALYFGEGGTYDANGLDDRAAMLSDVREVVSLMNHALQHLAAEIARR
jgi:hypothetical protein